MVAAAEVFALLEGVPDPEIPVISIRELGILREVVDTGEGEFEVVITPTYSGCPAMEQIADDVAKLLDRHHVRAKVVTRLAPAWTTDWITAEGRDKLRQYGIAPPGAGSAQAQVVGWSPRPPRASEVVPCPRCGSTNTTEVSHFASTACKSLWRCLACKEPFDHFKPY